MLGVLGVLMCWCGWCGWCAGVLGVVGVLVCFLCGGLRGFLEWFVVISDARIQLADCFFGRL